MSLAGRIGSRIRERPWLYGGIVFWGLLLAFCGDWFPWMRGYQEWGPGPEWRWRYEAGKNPVAGAILLALALGAGWGGLRLARRPMRRGGKILSAFALIALLLVFHAMATWTRTPRVGFLWAQRTCVEWLNSFFEASLVPATLGECWRDFDRLMNPERFPRVVTHPPGFVTYYAALRRAVEWSGMAERMNMDFWRKRLSPLEAAGRLSDTALAAMVLSTALQPVWAALALFPLLDLLRRHYSWSVALRVGLFYTLIPAVVLFVPSPDQLFLPLAITAVWGFALGCGARIGPKAAHERGGDARGDDSGGGTANASPPLSASAAASPPREAAGGASAWRRKWPLLLAGFAIGVHSLMGYHFTVILAILALWRALLAWRDHAFGYRIGRAAGRMAGDLALVLLPVLAVWALLQILFDYSYITHWIDGVGRHRGGITRYRSYWMWLGWNVWDLVFFLGLPCAAAVWAGLCGRGGWRSPFFWSVAAVLIAVNLSGTVRGETARILLFMYPLFALLLAPYLAGEETGSSRTKRLLLAQAAQLTCMAIYLNLF